MNVIIGEISTKDSRENVFNIRFLFLSLGSPWVNHPAPIRIEPCAVIKVLKNLLAYHCLSDTSRARNQDKFFQSIAPVCSSICSAAHSISRISRRINHFARRFSLTPWRLSLRLRLFPLCWLTENRHYTANDRSIWWLASHRVFSTVFQDERNRISKTLLTFVDYWELCRLAGNCDLSVTDSHTHAT
jgi:hypothetical protein